MIQTILKRGFRIDRDVQFSYKQKIKILGIRYIDDSYDRAQQLLRTIRFHKIYVIFLSIYENKNVYIYIYIYGL